MRTGFRVLSAWIPMVAAILVTTAGCTSSRVIRHAELNPGETFPHSLVYLSGGSCYEFLRVAVYPDTVIGEYKVNVLRESKEGPSWYEDEIHAHRMPLASVDSLAVLRRDPGKTALYIAGGAAVGYLLYRALNSRAENTGPPAGSKVLEASP